MDKKSAYNTLLLVSRATKLKTGEFVLPCFSKKALRFWSKRVVDGVRPVLVDDLSTPENRLLHMMRINPDVGSLIEKFGLTLPKQKKGK